MRLRELLAFDSIAIQCHTIPDADTLASGYGVYCYLKSAGKEPLLFYGGPKITKPNLTGMVERLNIPVRHAPELTEWDGLLVTVDCQYGAGNVSKVKAAHVAVIDHHIQEQELPSLSVLRPWLGSCATLVWDLLRQESYPVDIPLATALHYGLFTDTNGFSEVRHPLDRDMWDALEVDDALLKTLKLSNLSITDLSQVSEALNDFTACGDFRFALLPAPPCDPNILGFISDLSMQVDSVDMVVAYCCMPNGDVKFSVRTAVRNVKASDLAAWLAQGLGSGGGHREKAGGYLSGGKYQQSFGSKPFAQYFDETVKEYCRMFRILDCANAESLRLWPDIEAMSAYRKLPVTQGFVPFSSLFADPCELQLRMLEGDLTVRGSEETVLMIGIKGEIYPSDRRTFAKNYQETAGEYAPEFSYSPTVLNKTTGIRVSLQEYAKPCVSTRSDTVKALCLDQPVKVFTLWDDEEYLSGNPGDWIVASSPSDLYIVTSDVFKQIYARDFTGENISDDRNARCYVKRDLPVQVVFADRDDSLKTREGHVAYKEGDALLTGPGGDVWPVARTCFETRYLPEEGIAFGENGQYRPRGHPVYGIQVEEPFTVCLSGEKGLLQGIPGDWIVQYGPGEYGIVGHEIFDRTYVPAP
jgi:Exopolyphosphatase-related proteins